MLQNFTLLMLGISEILNLRISFSFTKEYLLTFFKKYLQHVFVLLVMIIKSENIFRKI